MSCGPDSSPEGANSSPFSLPFASLNPAFQQGGLSRRLSLSLLSLPFTRRLVANGIKNTATLSPYPADGAGDTAPPRLPRSVTPQTRRTGSGLRSVLRADILKGISWAPPSRAHSLVRDGHTEQPLRDTECQGAQVSTWNAKCAEQGGVNGTGWEDVLAGSQGPRGAGAEAPDAA